MLVYPAFYDLFNEARLINLEVNTSYHCPLLLEMVTIQHTIQVKAFVSRMHGLVSQCVLRLFKTYLVELQIFLYMRSWLSVLMFSQSRGKI